MILIIDVKVIIISKKTQILNFQNNVIALSIENIEISINFLNAVKLLLYFYAVEIVVN